MNAFTRRALQRIGVGAVALAAATAVAGLGASPAHAAEAADLEVSVTGTTLSGGAAFKFVGVTITNHGPATPTGVVLHLDLVKLLGTQVAVNLTGEGCTETASLMFDCPIPAEHVPAPGGSTDWAYRVERQSGAVEGPAGKFLVRVTHDGTDGVEANNSGSADVAIGTTGAKDLSVYADDVKEAWKLGDDGFPAFDSNDAPITDGPLTPGRVGLFVYTVVNHGDVHLSGATTAISLPANVEFAFQRDECTYGADNRTAQCNFTDLPMVPADEDQPGDNKVRGWFLSEPVVVAPGVAAPTSLTGGEVSAEGIVAPPETPSRAAAAPPRGAQGVSEDVDSTDNKDEFTVFVAAKPASGSLPITGAQVGLIGGMGALAVAVGGVLLFVSRRRRATDV